MSSLSGTPQFQLCLESSGREIELQPETDTMIVLLIGPAWVGDMVMAHTLVQTLQQQAAAEHQSSKLVIDLVAPKATLALGVRMPGVGRCIEMPLGHDEMGLGVRRRLGRQLRQRQYSQAIILPNSFKSALVPYFAGIPIRTGWTGEGRYGLLNDRRQLDPEVYPLMIERFMALGQAKSMRLTQPYPLPVLSTDRANSERLQAEFGLTTRSGVLVLCPGAEFGPAKRWPETHFAEVARAALAREIEVWLVGSPKDQPSADRIVELAPGVVNLAGRTSLLDAVDLLGMADQVVCNDSGLMHVAYAVGTQVVGLFGSTSPDFTPPLGDNASVLQQPIECSPCFSRVCPLGHMRCLQDLVPERVIETLSLR